MLKVEKGVLTSPGSTGNQTITLADTAFGTVKAVILWGVFNTAAGDTDGNGVFCIGFGTYRASTAEQWCCNTFWTDAAGTSDVAVGHTTAAILRGYNNATPTVDFVAALVSLGDASFVINWSDLPGTASIKFHYLALGGPDLTDARVINMDVTTGTGTQDFTVATGFGKPTLLFQTGLIGNTNQPADVATNAAVTLGVGKSDTESGVATLVDDDAAANMLMGAFLENDFVAMLTASANSPPAFNAVLSARSAWPTDGFQINKLNNAFGGTARIGVLALQGPFSCNVGLSTVPTAAPTVTTDLALTADKAIAKGALFVHNNLPTTAGVDSTHASLGTFGIGAMDGSHEGWAGIGDDDANTTAIVHRHHSENRTIKMFTPAAAGSLQSEATSGFFEGKNVRLTWADTDTIARQYVYVLLGDAPVPRHPGIQHQNPAII